MHDNYILIQTHKLMHYAIHGKLSARTDEIDKEKLKQVNEENVYPELQSMAQTHTLD